MAVTKIFQNKRKFGKNQDKFTELLYFIKLFKNQQDHMHSKTGYKG